MKIVSDKGIRAFYTAGKPFDNLTSAMAMQQYNLQYFNQSFEILTDDQGWYERVRDAVADQDPGYEDLSDFNCFLLILISGITSTILCISAGVTANIALKNNSFHSSVAVIINK